MLFFRKGFTLLEIIIVLALTGLFIAAASYLNRDTRTYQANAERLANYIDTSIRNAKSSMTLGRGVMSGGTLVTTDKRTISIRGTGVTTTYGTTNTGTESTLTWPFYDSDTAYQITDISVSSGILMNGHMPIWDQTGVTMADITVLPNGDFQVFSSSVATPIRILRITAGYAGFERSVMIDTVMGRTTSVQGRGEVDYIPAPPAPPPNSCAATPSFVNIGSTNVGSPTTAGQGWYYSATPGNCSYDCINGFKGASCLTPPTPTCDTNPSFPNLGTLTTGSPSSVAQAWYYSTTPGTCTYDCTNGYTGNNCLTAPVNGCAANPTYPNLGTLTTGSPSSWNQTWTYSTTPGTCTYDCMGGYSGPSCATAPFVTSFKTTWKVGTAGYGNGDNIVSFNVSRLPGAVIDWGDGIVEPLNTDNPSHTYLVPGDFTITIGSIDAFRNYANNNNYFGKLIAVNDWGGIVWSSMDLMFSYANNLNQLPLGAPNMSNVIDTHGMFQYASSFNQSVANFDTSKVIYMYSMFMGATNFNRPLTNFDTSKVVDMGGMFFSASSFNQSVANFDTSKVTSMYALFHAASSFNQSVANFDTSKVTNMNSMFSFASSFNQSVANFDTSNVTSMGAMFMGATAFNQSVSNFNTSKVTNMSAMFSSIPIFNQSVANFDTSKVTNMSYMFHYATVFNQSVSNFNTSNVTNMSYMFTQAKAFNQSVANFDTSKVVDMSGMFNFAEAFNQSVSNFNTSNVTNMASVFGNNSVFNQSVANFDTSKVTNMNAMFQNTTNFNQSVVNFDTSKVTNMDYMFRGTTAFNQDISNWCVTLIPSKPSNFDASGNIGFVNNPAKQPQWGTCPSVVVGEFSTIWKVGTPGYGNGDNTVSFYLTTVGNYTIDWGDGNIEILSTNKPSHTYATIGDKIIKISGTVQRFYPTNDAFNETAYPGKLTAVTDWGNMAWTSLDWMFFNADHLTSLPVTAPNLTNVTSMYRTFFNATLFNQDIGNWNTSNVTSMWLTFNLASSFNQPLNSWNVSNVTTMYGIFYSASAFNQPLNSWNVSKVIDMGSIFNFASSFNQDISNWNTSSATNMSMMFYGATAFNQPLSSWDVSKVTNMSYMFHMSAFNQPLNSWNTSSVTTMTSMFQQTPFNQNINTWNTTNVANMSYLFATTPFNQPLSSWNTSSVTNMQGMFGNNSSFNQPLNSWNTSSVTNMRSMFQSATAFNQPLSSWNTVNAVNMSYMFYNATAFNQNINTWNTANVTNMGSMFARATAFNQPLNSWNTTNVSNMSDMSIYSDAGMFANATAFNQDISNWCVSLIASKPSQFDLSGNAGFANNVAKQPQWGTCP